MLIYVLVLDGVFDIGLASLMDVMGTAQELIAEEKLSTKFQVRLVGVREQVKTAQGLLVPVACAVHLPKPDWVLVPALAAKMPAVLMRALRYQEVIDAGIWLKKWHKSGANIGAACTATFILAETGMLDGERATTSWWLASLFRQRYPLVKLDDTQMLVNSSHFTTAGAALAHIDLGLSVVRSRSPMLAALCARYLLVEPRSSQAAFIIPDHVAHTDPIVERFEQWARAHLPIKFSLQKAARAIGTSERTLGRRLRAVLGKSPLAYLQDLRIERAVHLLQIGEESVEHIASLVGYSDGATLRTLLRRRLGKGVRELRSRN